MRVKIFGERFTLDKYLKDVSESCLQRAFGAEGRAQKAWRRAGGAWRRTPRGSLWPVRGRTPSLGATGQGGVVWRELLRNDLGYFVESGLTGVRVWRRTAATKRRRTLPTRTATQCQRVRCGQNLDALWTESRWRSVTKIRGLRDRRGEGGAAARFRGVKRGMLASRPHGDGRVVCGFWAWPQHDPDVLSVNGLVTVEIYFVGVFFPLHIKLKLLFWINLDIFKNIGIRKHMYACVCDHKQQNLLMGETWVVRCRQAPRAAPRLWPKWPKAYVTVKIILEIRIRGLLLNCHKFFLPLYFLPWLLQISGSPRTSLYSEYLRTSASSPGKWIREQR